MTRLKIFIFLILTSLLFASCNNTSDDSDDANYPQEQLGLILNEDGTATFKTWSNTASSCDVLLFESAVEALAPTAALPSNFPEARKIAMTKSGDGYWTAESVQIGINKYYQYRITNDSTTYNVADIWHTVAGPDSVASQIASVDDASAKPDEWEIEYTNPFTGDDYTKAVIYEMHIRDWSRVESPNSTGKFLEIANSEKIISHLTDLGVTHVQILPMFDYAQKNDDENYNWGYNPYHYNVPEGRYVTKGYTDGTQAVKEMRTMIQKLHEAGIAVIMDVVYNHTNGTKTGSLYDMTVPQYFYRMKDGSYSNGSGCGNEVATNNVMVRKYVIESLKHWMNDYHINGFRFDLMGLHEQETMARIYQELKKIDPKVIVYGEPWMGGSSTVVNGCTGAVASSGYGVGAFDDDFRDAIKGPEYGGFQLGQVQGIVANKTYYNDDGIIAGLTGKSGKNNRNSTGKPGLALHYVECHDNYTLYDKLAYSIEVAKGVTGIVGKENCARKFNRTPSTEEIELIKRQDKLAAAYIFLSQGTPFINGGQEFLRTKNGNPDSYSADSKGGIKWTNEAGNYNIDDCNTINLDFKTKYSDVYNTYKGLIALRKANSSAFGSNKDAKAETLEKGVTKYTTGDFLVYFNATDEAVVIATTGYTKAVDVSSGTPTDSALPTTVAAKSFVILKK
ncbi:MAG: alpha-amylase [Treponemataceae bacterium]|nr:alpha-amylase [Treponemataceae bacterium]